MELIIPFPADLIISIAKPDGPPALPVFILAIDFDIMSDEMRSDETDLGW